ncbi:MAG: phosphotransferase [Dehalococcoidia bacterium]
MAESEQPDKHPWTDDDWREEALAWVRDELGTQGMTISGEVEQPHLQWWSTALRIPTTGGVVWFKASRQSFEAALTPLLARVRPAQIAEVIATDPDRAWLLTRDAGVRLREAAPGLEQLARWREFLPQYAQLQIELASKTGEMLALGVTDHRLAEMPGQLRRVLEDRSALFLDNEDSLSEDDYERLRAGLAEFKSLCKELAGAGIPESLQHDDLHDGNLFVRDGKAVFFDRGDACISHPFHTLVVTLRATAYKLGLEPVGPEITSMRDAYLEGWSAFGSHEELVEIAEMARRTGTVQRALEWYYTATQMPPSVRAENIDSVPYGLKLYLANGPYGTWQ